jgi:aldose 1-epimerase
MQNPLTLRNGELVCDLKPALGGCIAGLWFSGIPVLRSTPANDLHSVRQAASYPLVPFSNRVSQAHLQWQGTAHPLVRNWAPDPHAIHGVGWERPWAVLEASDSFALLSYEHQADASWPFAFDSSQAFKLKAHALELSLSITNQSATAIPVGLGWHPFFVKRPDSRVQFASTGRWEMGDDKLPTHRAPHTGLDTACATLDVDHCFDGWAGTVQLHDSLLRTRVSSSLGRLVVYSTPQSDSIAIEPVSHVNDAVNRMAQTGAHADDLGICVLHPGDTFSCAMRIETERTP